MCGSRPSFGTCAKDLERKQAWFLSTSPTRWILAFRCYQAYDKGKQEGQTQKTKERTEEREHFSRGTRAELALATHHLVFTCGRPFQAMVTPSVSYHSSWKGKKKCPREATTNRKIQETSHRQDRAFNFFVNHIKGSSPSHHSPIMSLTFRANSPLPWVEWEDGEHCVSPYKPAIWFHFKC